MTSYHSDKNKKIVSALDTALKLLLALWKKTKYFMGLFLIDNLMRNIVSWYDERHLKATANSENKDKADYQRIEAILKAKENECHGLQSQLDVKRDENQNLKEQIIHLRSTLDGLKESCAKLQQDNSGLKKKIGILKAEIDGLQKRCLPESDVPSMIYFAQGDATGLWLRKVSTAMSIGHMYKLITKPGDTSICNFSPIKQDNMAEVIANRSVTLLACEIIGIAPAASAIEIIEDGVAALENNRWKVTHKAKIKLV